MGILVICVAFLNEFCSWLVFCGGVHPNRSRHAALEVCLCVGLRDLHDGDADGIEYRGTLGVPLITKY